MGAVPGDERVAAVLGREGGATSQHQHGNMDEQRRDRGGAHDANGSMFLVDRAGHRAYGDPGRLDERIQEADDA